MTDWQGLFGDPPRRYDCRQDRNDMCFGLEPLLDGEPAANVVAYDCDNGWILRHVIGLDGRPVVEGEHFKLERVWGKVAVRWRPQRQAA